MDLGSGIISLLIMVLLYSHSCIVVFSVIRHLAFYTEVTFVSSGDGIKNVLSLLLSSSVDSLSSLHVRASV